MNLVNYSDDSGSENEQKVSKQQQQIQKEINISEQVQPETKQKVAKKKQLLGLDEILNQESLADGKYIPHKKIKLNEDEVNPIKEQANQNTLKKSEEYQIQDLSRTRKMPHIDGQFACYIYIDINIGLSSLVKAQTNFKNRVSRDFPNYQFQEIQPDNFHISLSKTFYLNRHQIEPFMTSLRDKYLKNFQQMSISLDLNKLKVFSNEDRNRFFIAASVGQGKNVVKEIVDQIDNCLQAYGLDTFFKGNKHHVSILWTTNKATQSPEFKLYVKDNRFNSSGTDGQITLDVQDVQVKIGNRINSVKLQSL